MIDLERLAAQVKEAVPDVKMAYVSDGKLSVRWGQNNWRRLWVYPDSNAELGSLPTVEDRQIAIRLLTILDAQRGGQDG